MPQRIEAKGGARLQQRLNLVAVALQAPGRYVAFSAAAGLPTLSAAQRARVRLLPFPNRKQFRGRPWVGSHGGDDPSKDRLMLRHNFPAGPAASQMLLQSSALLRV